MVVGSGQWRQRTRGSASLPKTAWRHIPERSEPRKRSQEGCAPPSCAVWCFSPMRWRGRHRYGNRQMNQCLNLQMQSQIVNSLPRDDGGFVAMGGTRSCASVGPRRFRSSGSSTLPCNARRLRTTALLQMNQCLNGPMQSEMPTTHCQLPTANYQLPATN